MVHQMHGVPREEYFEIPEKNEVQFKDEYVSEFFNDIDGWD